MAPSQNATSLTHPVEILQFLSRAMEIGQKCALIVVTGIKGGGVRAPGALMAVTETGSVAGYVSNGCVDADVVANALSLIDEGGTRTLVYGEDSPFLDIRLPCGGQIELFLTANLSAGRIANAMAALSARNAIELVIEPDQPVSFQEVEQGETLWRNGSFHVFCEPKLRLRIAGKGAEVLALADLVSAAGYECLIQSPEDDLLDQAQSRGHLPELLTTPELPPRLTDDRWTAFVMMFHDHDWESHLLQQALRGPAFYVGALGSVRTHEIRSQRLLDMNVPRAQIARIRAPIGVLPRMRNASALAISVLAEILQVGKEGQFETL